MMKTYKAVTIALAALAAVAIAGYVNADQGGKKKQSNRIDSGPVHMEMTVPATAGLGTEYLVVMEAGAVENAKNVVVSMTVPPNASYVRSEPAATVDGKQLTWQVGTLDLGDSREIKVWLKAEQESPVVAEAGVSAVPRMYATTQVVK
jgi:hypothetical protein